MMRKKVIRIVSLTLVILAEVGLASYLWKSWTPPADFGFLVKAGPEYVLGWRANGSLQYNTYHTLEGALAYAHRELKLENGRVLDNPAEIESLWVDERLHGYIVFWKLDSSPLLNQTTFPTKKDAMYFAEAFRSRHYSTSPFGHSVMMVPQK